MKKFEAYIDENKFGDTIPQSWEYAAAYLNDLIDALPEDENGEIDRDEVDAIWEAYCHGDYDKDMAENANAEQLAAMIRDRDTWDADMLRMLCEKAGMLEAWEAADGDTFETVAFAAAEKLGVEIIGGGN